MEHFKLIITLVDRGKGGKAVDLYRNHHLHFDFACLGAGTASSRILNYFGLDETLKELVWTLAPESRLRAPPPRARPPRGTRGAARPGPQVAVFPWHQFLQGTDLPGPHPPLGPAQWHRQDLAPVQGVPENGAGVDLPVRSHIAEHGFRLAVDLPVQHMAADGPVRLPAVVRGQGHHLLGDQRPELTF